MMVVKRLLKHLVIIILVVSSCSLFGLTRWPSNDPAPMYSSMDPFEFMQICCRKSYKNDSDPCDAHTFRFSFTPYTNWATTGSDIDNNEVEIGNILGGPVPQVAGSGIIGNPWDVVALFYDDATRTMLIKSLDLGTPSYSGLYPDAPWNGDGEQVSFCQTFLDPRAANQSSQINLVTSPTGNDTKQQFGRFDVPINYRKSGLRFETEFGFCDFSLKLQGGVCHIHQNAHFNDLTCQATGVSCAVRKTTYPDEAASGCTPQAYNCNPPPDPQGDAATTPTPTQPECQTGSCCQNWADCACKMIVRNKIMKQQDLINYDLNVSTDSFDKTAFEDMELNLNWAHMFSINENKQPSWAHFIFTPFLTAGVTFPTGYKTGKLHNDDESVIEPMRLFALSTGNNGHWSYGGQGGFTFDFTETIGIGFQAGITGFSKRTYAALPFPTQVLQSGYYPYTGKASMQPGINWSFLFQINCYHFVDRLSAILEFVGIGHEKNKIDLISPNKRPADDTTPYPEDLLVNVMEERSWWRSNFIQGRLNYDLSTNIRVGFGFQVPIFQRQAYRPYTVVGTLDVIF
jgi:hypothetical protein